uniref:CASP-like protein n=1 Tax=Oryza brachyantha TaxID=4533 RepID=J3LU49_ORYBR
MASNKHGHGGAQDFDNYPEYRYCLGISIIAALYTISQVVRDVHRLSRGRDVIAARKAAGGGGLARRRSARGLPVDVRAVRGGAGDGLHAAGRRQPVHRLRGGRH